MSEEVLQQSAPVPAVNDVLPAQPVPVEQSCGEMDVSESAMDQQSNPNNMEDITPTTMEDIPPSTCTIEQPPPAPSTPVTDNPGDIDDNRKLFVGGVSQKSSTETLKTYFERFGAVEAVDLKTDSLNNCHRGFCFVTMGTSESIQNILADPNHEIDGKKVECKLALSHAEHQARKHRTNKVFVGGVPTDMEEDVIKEYFSQFGEIGEVALVTEKGSQNRRRFVFVVFKDFTSVDVCTKQSFHSLCGCQVEVKRATPRDEDGGGGGGGGGMYYGGGGGRGGRGRGGMRGGRGRGGWRPYGQHSYGGYGGDMGYGDYYHGDGYGYNFADHGGGYGGPSRYGPMKGHPGGSRGYHPYGR